MKYTITENFANKVLAYLGTRPFNEVSALINEFNDKDNIAVFTEELPKSEIEKVEKKK